MLAQRFVAVLIIMGVIWVGLQVFLPVVGELVLIGEDMGTFSDDAVIQTPDWWVSGIWTIFALSMGGILFTIIVWAIIGPLERMGVGHRR